MARIFITGSADGLGRMAAELLIEQGHRVVLHARSQARADETKRNVPEAEAVVIGDLGTIAQTRKAAEQLPTAFEKCGRSHQSSSRDF